MLFRQETDSNVLIGFVCLKDTGCFECQGSLCNVGDFYNSAPSCADSCKVLNPKKAKAGVICSSDFQCLPCTNDLCDLGAYHATMSGCEQNCIQYPALELNYHCKVGKCVSCMVDDNCPAEKPLFSDKLDCLANCTTPRRQPKKDVEKYYCKSPENDCTKCVKGKDCPKKSFKTADQCAKKCIKPPVLEERYYCDAPYSCTNCTTNKDCPPNVGLYKEEEVCLVTCVQRKPEEFRFFCDTTLHQCRQCTVDCPTNVTLYYTTHDCIYNCNVNTKSNTGLYSCSSDGKCYPCTLTSGCGLANSQVCAFLPLCTPYAVFNDKKECTKECNKKAWYCKKGKGCVSCKLPKCPKTEFLCTTKEQCESLCFVQDSANNFMRHPCKDEKTEVFDLCPYCERTCDTSVLAGRNCDVKKTNVKRCKPACVCKPGYVRDAKKKCISFNECPKCPALAMYRMRPYGNSFFGNNACPPTCDQPDPYLDPAGCRGTTVAGCQCPPGFFMNTTKPNPANKTEMVEPQCMPLSMCPHPINWYCGASNELRACVPCKPASCPTDVLNYQTKEDCDYAVIKNPYLATVCKRVRWPQPKYIETVSLNRYLGGDDDNLKKFPK